MADFETEMATILAAVSWTTCSYQPQTNYGDVNSDGYNPAINVRVRGEDEDPSNYTTYTGSIVAKEQAGTIEGKAMTSSSRNKMIADLEAGLYKQGVLILKSVPSTYKNVYRFYMNVMRIE